MCLYVGVNNNAHSGAAEFVKYTANPINPKNAMYTSEIEKCFIISYDILVLFDDKRLTLNPVHV